MNWLKKLKNGLSEFILLKIANLFYLRGFLVMGFVKAINGKFTINGNIKNFLGCNMYGLGKVADWQAKQMLDDAKQEGFDSVRFWAFEPTEKLHFEFICNYANELGLYLLPCLADKWGYLQHYRINNEWYISGYREHYLKYAKDMVMTFKDREEVILWEIINEPVTDTFESIYNFTQIVSDELKTINDNHLLSIGTVGGIGDKFGSFTSIFSHENFEKLYSITALDAVSIHDYSHDSTIAERLEIYYTLIGRKNLSYLFRQADNFFNLLPDRLDEMQVQRGRNIINFPLSIRKIWRNNLNRNIESAARLNKPIYAGEAGFKKKHGDFRYKMIEVDVKQKFSKGFSGYFLWSYESMGASYDGHGYGISVGEVKNIISELQYFLNL